MLPSQEAVRLKEKGVAKEVLAVSMGPPVVQVSGTSATLTVAAAQVAFSAATLPSTREHMHG